MKSIQGISLRGPGFSTHDLCCLNLVLNSDPKDVTSFAGTDVVTGIRFANEDVAYGDKAQLFYDTMSYVSLALEFAEYLTAAPTSYSRRERYSSTLAYKAARSVVNMSLEMGSRSAALVIVEYLKQRKANLNARKNSFFLAVSIQRDAMLHCAERGA